MNLLKLVNEWVQKGFQIKYHIVNQIEEHGLYDEVLSGDLPNFTYTFVIDEMEEEIWSYSVDSLEEGFTLAINWLQENR